MNKNQDNQDPEPEGRQPEDQGQKPKFKVDVSGSRGVVIGDFASVVQNFIHDPQLRKWLVGVGIAIILAVTGASYWLYGALRDKPAESGFRIAVAAFSEIGSSGEKNLGRRLGLEIAELLRKDLVEIGSPGEIHILGPDDGTGPIRGETAQDRAQAAEKMAEKNGYFIVIYGTVKTTGTVWQVLPEFYIAPGALPGLYVADEITGQHDLGAPVRLTAGIGLPGLLQLEALSARTKGLALITIGLAHYAVHEYAQALEAFQAAEVVPGWEEEQGKHVVYLFAGNAAGKDGQLDLAEEYFQKSLGSDSEYARAQIGLGGVYYQRALAAAQDSDNPGDADAELLQKSIACYQAALTAEVKPPLADIDSKLRFGLGQDLTVLNIVNGDPDFGAAIAEFERVVADYGGGDNPRLRELAAEAHARLGLIYRLQGETERSIGEYEQAVALLEADPERQALYQRTLTELQNDPAAP